MPQREMRGVKLAWEEAGDGLPVVLLHPFPLNRAAWSRQREHLSKKYRIITPDLRGFGGSNVDGEVSTMEVFAEDLAALLDELRVHRVVLGGLSLGGYVALAFYRKFPQRVRGLILAHTKSQADDDRTRKNRQRMADKAMKEGAGAVGQAMLPDLFGESTFRLKPHLPIATWRKMETNSSRGAAAALRGMALRADSTGLLAEISCPVLVVAGAEDKLAPPALAEKMAKAIPDATLEIIPGAAHLSNIEQPEAFNTILQDFLEDFPV